MKYRPDIDGLRTVAVLPVVFYHAGVTGFPGGFVGVDIFFVISGFLITTIIYGEMSDGRFSILRFYERRARRILPPLFAVMVVSLVAGWFILVPDDFDHMGQSILSALIFVSNMWFWQNSRDYFGGATDYLPMLHTWSLAVEEQFYIFFPLLLMALHRYARRLLLPAIGLLVLGSLVLAIHATPRMPSASFYLLPTRIWELGIGSLLALGLPRIEAPRALREAAGLLGLISVLAPVFLYNSQMQFPGVAALPPVLGAALLIWAGTAGPVWASRLLSLRPMVWIGLISYSLYLWHWPIMAFVRNRLFSVELDPAWQVVTVLASVLAGWISWRIVERPFRVPSRQGGMTQRRIFAMSGAGMAALGALAVAVILTGGMATQRFSDAQLAALETIVGPSEERQECSGVRPISRLCTFGSADPETAPRWLMLGDSHAASMLPAMIDLSESRGRRLVFAKKGGCPPLPQVHRSDMPPSENARCEVFRQAALDMALSDDRFETVFLVARWPLYGEGRQVRSEGHTSFRLIDTAGNAPGASNTAVLEASLERLARQLIDRGKTVVIVQSVPELPWNAVDRIESEILFGVPFLDDRETLARVQARQAATNAALAAVGVQPSVTVIPLAEVLCTPDCPVRVGLNSYYRDNNHITALGAKLLVPFLDRAVPGGLTASENP